MFCLCGRHSPGPGLAPRVVHRGCELSRNDFDASGGGWALARIWRTPLLAADVCDMGCLLLVEISQPIFQPGARISAASFELFGFLNCFQDLPSASLSISWSLNCFQDLPSASFELFGSLTAARTCPVPVLSFLGPLTAWPVPVLSFFGSLNCFQDLPSASFELFGSLNCFQDLPSASFEHFLVS